MTFSLTNINTSESIGTSILNVIKGGAQLLSGIIDKALDSNFGVLDLAATGIALYFVVWVIQQAVKAKGYGQRALQ